MLKHSGRVVKCAMEQLGLSQGELARRIGRHQSLISRYLAGKCEISDKTARAIAGVLELRFETLRIRLERDRYLRQAANLDIRFKHVIL